MGMVLLEIHEENKDYDAHKALVNAFGAFDTGKDGAVSDGMVSVTKLKENLTTMGEVMTEYEINAMLKDIPQDNNMVPFMPLVERLAGGTKTDLRSCESSLLLDFFTSPLPAFPSPS